MSEAYFLKRQQRNLEREERKVKKWQNLIEKKCPNCGSEFEDVGMMMRCPNFNPNGSYCFLINRVRAAQILLDPTHPAHTHIPYQQRGRIRETIMNWGKKFNPAEVEMALEKLNLI